MGFRNLDTSTVRRLNSSTPANVSDGTRCVGAFEQHTLVFLFVSRIRPAAFVQLDIEKPVPIPVHCDIGFDNGGPILLNALFLQKVLRILAFPTL